MVDKIFFLSMESLFAALFWGNAVSLLFLFVYRQNSRKKQLQKEQKLLNFLMLTRLCHTFYYFVALGRGILPDWLSISVGNTMLFVGFYFEARAILSLIRESSKGVNYLLLGMLLLSIALFNTVEYIMPSDGMRVAISSVCMFVIMALPCVRMLMSKDSSTFAKSASSIYCIFLLLLLPRAWYSFQHQEVGLLTQTALQSLTFLSLFLQLVISLPFYIFIIKEYADDALILMATTDKLTGAANRHAFMDAAVAIYENCRRLHHPLSVLFIDIDYFKQVNDQYGHGFGDTVLARLAAIIDQSLRGSDLSCRYGGEEFVVVLSRAEENTARIVAERIEQGVRSAHFSEQPEFSFTVSIGVSSGVPSARQGMESFIKDADRAMYIAKDSGRNQIIMGRMDQTKTEQLAHR